MTVATSIVLWVAAILRLRACWSQRSLVNIAYAIAILSLAGAVTAKVLERSIDSATGPYASDLLEHLLVVVGGVSAQVFFIGLRASRPSARQLATTLTSGFLAIAIMTFAFGLADIRTYRGDLDDAYGHTTAIVIYRMSFESYLLFVLVLNVKLCRRYVRTPGDNLFTSSLRLLMVGSVVAVGYPVSRIAFQVWDFSTGQHLDDVRRAGSAASVAGLALLAAGVLTPRFALATRRWAAGVRVEAKLRPLWSDLIGAFPELELRTSAAITPQRAQLRCDRRVVEIAEGLARVRAPADACLVSSKWADSLASHLVRTRPFWAATDGVPVADLLPRSEDWSGERVNVIRLARAYARRAANQREIQLSSSEIG